MDLLGALDREKEVMGLLLLTVWSLRSRKEGDRFASSSSHLPSEYAGIGIQHVVVW